MNTQTLTEEVKTRRAEEIEALQAYYDTDFQSSLFKSQSNIVSIEGPWFIKLTKNNSTLGIPVLEIRLPPCYPLGTECPQPIIHNVMMNPKTKDELLQELKDMYDMDVDVGILWAERCREELEDEINQGDEIEEKIENIESNKEVQTFIPPSTKYNQSIRHFPIDIITNPKYGREIIHTAPFHPPKSGPSETMIAHVAQISCMEHIHWILAELLFNNKKVAKATHNMFAYRFYSNDILVSDNDDDGEKGSGSKLASLLELANVDNVIVVVSRWFGGVHLGPARFKWIASVGRDGLKQAGFIKN